MGTVVRATAVFTDADTGDPVLPTEVVLRIERPDGDVEERRLSTGQVLRDPVVPGGFYADLDTLAGPPGTWHYQYENSGAARVTRRQSLTIRGRI
jgi:hypothetical protein